ncbi:hypothetical protein PV08_02637 [Exophiala spinifera]|uniref:Uncharacterized protein n=1 Tax=Exophiala spinifera TaxID=91928 RepID=A0A0D2C3Y4_9EURO|nr:uncharacterized protein PV08_02637 [Exophiala spinifera]KIW18349.1 hypothetical protein PV08_02637 [Exophiala spinifera]
MATTGKRLAEAKTTSLPSPEHGSSESPESSAEGSERVLLRSAITSVPRSPTGYPLMIGLSTKPDVCLTTTTPASVYAALFHNGAMMGLTCSITFASKSKPFGQEIPESLRPTPLQLSTIHPQWIDRFPFPKMRDNMITLLSIIDEEEFLGDLFCLTSFTVDSRFASWDPSGWKIGNEFSAKWGYLFY